MGLRFDPVGGGQFKQAVQQMVEAESQPIKTIEARKAKEDARLKLFQDFKGKFSNLEKALSEISTFQKLRELKIDMGDGANLASVTVDKERADPGQYSIEIDELAVRSSSISNGFENPDEPILGGGSITVQSHDGSTFEVSIDDGDSSLRGVAKAVNKDPTLPIRASVIKDDADPDAPWKLLLVSKKEGVRNEFSSPELYFLNNSEDFSIEDDKQAQNGQLLIDGFPIETESNDIKDFLPGVNLHLKQARPDQPFTLTISEDYQKVSGKIKNLVDQINQVLQFIVKQNTVDKTSDTSTTFAGDTSLQTIEFKLRNIIHQGFSATDNPDDSRALFLNRIGIEFEKTGLLSFKEDRFNKALENDFDGIATALTGQFGLVSQMKEAVGAYTRSGNGLLAAREQGIRSRIRSMDDEIARKTQAVERKKQNLVDQFSRLEGTLGNLQKQQQYLAAVLPGGGGGGGSIAQLLGG